MTDDAGRTLKRGARTTVDEETFAVYTQRPYADSVIPLGPRAGDGEGRDAVAPRQGECCGAVRPG